MTSMDVTNYAVPVLGGAVVMGSCWIMGHYEFSMMWIVFFVILNAVKAKLWKERQRRVTALQQTALREKEVIMAQLKDLPAWVQFPDTERVEWMNKVVFQLWPYIGEYCKKFIKEIVEPQVKAHMPNAFKSFRFEEIDMGDVPLRVGGIKVYSDNVGRDKIIMDMDVAYAGDCEFVVAVGAFKGGLRQIQFKGKLRAILNPLIPKPPMIAGVSAFFLDNPTIDFDLTGLGEFVELPGLIGAVRNVINEQVASICVLPNEIVIPLSGETDVVKLYFPVPDGIVRIHVLDAKNLENADVILRGKSDPYTRLSIGGQNFKTKTIDNTLNPTWDEYFEAVVDQASGQKLLAEVFDDDPGSNDDFIGRMSLDLSMVKEKGILDEWYPLEGVKHGDLHIIAYWYHLSTDSAVLKRKQELLAGKPRSTLNNAILMVYIDNVSGLPSSKQDFEPSPYVEFTLGNDKQKTFPRPKTRNPLYRQKFIFYVNNVEQQLLKIEAKDDSTNGRSLGDFTLAVRSLLTEPNLEIYQQTYHLSLGPHLSPILLSARLRFLDLGEVDRSANSLDKSKRSESQFGSTEFSSQQTSITGSPQMGRGALRLRKKKRRGIFPREGHHGRIQFGLSYDGTKQKLLVNVINCQALMPISNDNQMDPYVSVKLLKNGLLVTKRKTAALKSTLNPSFEENFQFDLFSGELGFCTLAFDVKDASKSGWFHETPVIGQVLFDMTKFESTQTILEWFELKTACYYDRPEK